MFTAVGVGAYAAGVFHLMTHAFFKACLFLGSGSVIHAMGGEQDMRKMGGLRKHMPMTFWTFLAATLAICGFPPFAGFMSKDEILLQAFAHGHHFIWALTYGAAGLTAFYMFRQVYMTFFGEFRGTHEQEHHLHESPPSMSGVLIVLGVLSVLGGFVMLPGFVADFKPFERLSGTGLQLRVHPPRDPGADYAYDRGRLQRVGNRDGGGGLAGRRSDVSARGAEPGAFQRAVGRLCVPSGPEQVLRR